MCSRQLEVNIPLVNLHILGVQKAGTTALAHFLSQHPDICVVEGKEAHVFDQPDYQIQTDKLAFAQRRYLKKLSHYNGEIIICDATPITLLNPTYVQSCYDYNPEARFIVMVRDPVDRAISHYNMSKSRGREKYNMLLSFLVEPWRLRKEKQSDYWTRKSAWRDLSYLKRGEYKQQLKAIRNLACTNNLLVISQEDLLEHHQQTLEKVFAFLYVKPHKVRSEIVFSQPSMPNSVITVLARLYAKAYFLFHS